MSTISVDEVYGYIQERCLWQFFSRSWDREENIQGVLGTVTTLLSGNPIKPTTPMERLFYADGKILADAIKSHFPDITGLGQEQVTSIVNEIKDRLMKIAVTESRNHELTDKLY